jgi:hypothetical protein
MASPTLRRSLRSVSRTIAPRLVDPAAPSRRLTAVET